MLKSYDALAKLTGSSLAPDLRGSVKFLKVPDGSWVVAEVFGLPEFTEATDTSPQIGPFGFHIHEFDTCGQQSGDSPFLGAGAHWNPDGEPHGNHAGDFPVLFSNGGTAKMMFFTNKFFPEDVIGRSVVIHQSPDDYKTQPASGGKRIACGVIVPAPTLGQSDFDNPDALL